MEARWIQKDGEIDIELLSPPVPLVETEWGKATVSFYSNNEPHIHLTEIRAVSADAIKHARAGMEEIKAHFHSLGYDKIYTLIKDTDIQSKRLVALLGFEPKIIYEDAVGTRYIKHDMETK